MLELNSWQIFYYCVELKGFSKAAAHLGVSKSLVSKKIALLEQHYKTKLIHRKRGVFTLTAAGHAILPYCKAMVASAQTVDLLLEEQHQVFSGEINISAPQLIAELLSQTCVPEFQAKYPKIRVSLQVDTRKIDLVRDSYDLSIRSARMMGELDYIQRYFMQCEFVICASPLFNERYGAVETVDALANKPCIAYSSATKASYSWPFKDAEQEQNVTIAPEFTSNQWTVLKNYAKNKAVLLRAPTYLVQNELASGELFALTLNLQPSPTDLYLLYEQRELLPKHVRVFMEYLLQWAKSNKQKF